MNAVCPGPIETDMLREQFREQASREQVLFDAVRERPLGRIPLHRLHTIESVASAIGFLVSDDAWDITGVALDVSGGMVLD